MIDEVGEPEAFGSVDMGSASDECSEFCFSGDSCVDAGIDAAALFAGVELPHSEPAVLAELRAASRRDTSKLETVDLSHSALVKRALSVSGVDDNLPTRKRLSGKKPFDVTLLQQLRTDPSSVTRAQLLPRQHHKDGYHEFRRWYIAMAGVTWREGEIAALKLWSKYSNDQKYHWILIRKAGLEYGLPHLTKAPPSKLRIAADSPQGDPSAAQPDGTSPPEETTQTVVGLLLTYFLKLGHDDPDVGTWIRQGLKGDDLRKQLLTKPAYSAYFEAFVVFIKQLRDTYGFKSCCACMELGDDSTFAARVHLHAYVGFLQKDSGIAAMYGVKVPSSALIFCNMKPYTVATRGLKGRRLHDAVGQGMYYVTGPKSTGMLRYTDLEPIKETKSIND